MKSDEELSSILSRARNRDIDALERLVDLYSARLHGFMYRMTGRPDESEELVQEVFVRLVKAIQSYEEDGRFEAWLFRIAANLARDRARRRGRDVSVPLFDDEATDDADGALANSGSPAAEAIGPDAALILTEEIAQLQAALNTLPIEEREVVMLRHYTDLSFAEIASLMDTPLGTALARSHRALHKLRQRMETES